jgi:hypothetical protein
MSGHEMQRLTADDIVLDAIPEDVEATIRIRDAWLGNLSQDAGGLEFILSDVRRWRPTTQMPPIQTTLSHGHLCGSIPTELLTLRRRGFTIDEIF